MERMIRKPVRTIMTHSNVLQQSMTAQEVHDSYIGLQKVERDFRAMKTGLLEVRPVFVRKKSRTRGHAFCCMLALKLRREMERRLRAAFGTTDSDPHAITLPDALTSLSHLSQLQYQVDEKTTATKLPQPCESQRDPPGRVDRCLRLRLETTTAATSLRYRGNYAWGKRKIRLNARPSLR